MKEKELREHTECDICHNKIGHVGIPFFWTVKIKQHGIKMDAVKRQDGLTAMLGGHAGLANIMGTDEDMTQTLTDIELTVCALCAIEKNLPVAVLADK